MNNYIKKIILLKIRLIFPVYKKDNTNIVLFRLMLKFLNKNSLRTLHRTEVAWEESNAGNNFLNQKSNNNGGVVKLSEIIKNELDYRDKLDE